MESQYFPLYKEAIDPFGIGGKTYGYMLFRLPLDIMESLKNEVEIAKQNSINQSSYQNELAAQVNKSHTFIHPKNLDDFILKGINVFDQTSGYISRKRTLFNNRGKFPKLNTQSESSWIIFQKKYEYNPPHTHFGILSWIIWYDIPYLIEDEKKYGPGKYKTNTKSTDNGNFNFLIPNRDSIEIIPLPVDKRWNGTLCLFPSNLHHSVNPFYTSDDYRIVISGNIHYQN